MGGTHTDHRGLPLLTTSCIMLLATAVNEFVIGLLEYADFLGLLGGMTLSGSIHFNHVIVDAFRVAALFLAVTGIFQVLSSKTTHRE